MKKIAYVTDIHLDETFPLECGVDTRKNWMRILDDIANREIDEIIFGGDIGDATAHQYFFESLNRYTDKLNISLGNHDQFDKVMKYYKHNLIFHQTALYYSYEDDFFKCIFLDSSTDVVSQLQLEWLSTELKSNKKIILFIHHPLLEMPVAVDKLYALKNRNNIVEMLTKCGQEVTVFCAHYHMIDERKWKNITQFITPAASFQIKKDEKEILIDAENFGYRILSIDENKVSSEIILFKS